MRLGGADVSADYASPKPELPQSNMLRYNADRGAYAPMREHIAR